MCLACDAHCKLHDLHLAFLSIPSPSFGNDFRHRLHLHADFVFHSGLGACESQPGKRLSFGSETRPITAHYEVAHHDLVAQHAQ